MLNQHVLILCGLLATSTLIPTSSVAEPALDARVKAVETGLRPAYQYEGDAERRWTIEERLQHWNVPGVSVAVLRQGKLAWAKGYGVKETGTDDRVDTDTVFSTGSVSKMGTAAIMLRLLDDGIVNLDDNVNNYLSRWKLPENAYTAIRPVTVRGILSHTAGLTLHGFPDFLPGEPLPSVLDTLDGKAPAGTEPVRVVQTPGSLYRYSGGGTTISQLVIEEATGSSFVHAAQHYLFEPLGMRRSTYENPLPASHGNIAKAHDGNGRLTALPRGWHTMPEMAASGLWSTPSDLAKLMIALIDSYHGAESSFLERATAEEMMTEVGLTDSGLGPTIEGSGVHRYFKHSGSNDSYKAIIEGYLHSGNGLVILTNGSRGANLINEIRRSIAAAENWPAFEGVVVLPKYEPAWSGELSEYVGIYEGKQKSDLYAVEDLLAPAFSIVLDDKGYLHWAVANERYGSRLLQVDRTNFILEDNPRAHLRFVRGYDGRIDGYLHAGTYFRRVNNPFDSEK